MTPFALDHPAVADYLRRLDAATAHLPADERVEIAEGIRSHLITALGEAHTEADVRSTLDALGDPEEIVGSPPPQPVPQFTAAPSPRRSARGGLEITAVIFLLLGALIVPFVGWFVGVVLVWVSKAWTTREKLLATFVVPGGLATAVALSAFAFAFAAPTCVVTMGGATQVTPDSGSAPLELVQPTEVCSGAPPEWLTIAIMAFLVIAPIVVAVHLLRVAGQRPAV